MSIRYLFNVFQFISTLLPHDGGDHGLVKITLKKLPTKNNAYPDKQAYTSTRDLILGRRCTQH